MQTNLIVGAIGHIDHGKTSLIESLNGFWGDSTTQEKEQGITLDLSFSHLTKDNQTIAFIDVPGHEKLVKNMIAGAFGMDCAMLVVAANEGIMPQTLEHLRIAFLLGIREFLVVLSKCDLATEEMKIQRTKDIESLLHGFKGIHYQITQASIHDKQSIDKLQSLLFALPKRQHKDLGFFRYYIDRVFAIKGSGCVVSGTLMDGDLNLTDKVWCARLERNLTIKALQTHGQSTQIAYNGSRVAINLSGISHNELTRGDLLTKKGYLRGFDTIEVELSTFHKIAHNSELQLYIGSMRCACRILLLGAQMKFATLKTKIPIFSIFNERFILRDDKETLGGGRVLSPIVDPMKKSQKLEFLESLSQSDFKGAFEILLCAHKRGLGLISTIQRFGIPQSAALKIASEIPHCFVCPKELIAYPKSARETLTEMITKILAKNKNALLSAALLAQKQSWIAQDFAKDVLEELFQKGALDKTESFYVAKDNPLDFSNLTNITDYLHKTIHQTLLAQGYEPIAPYNLYDALDIDRKTGDEVFKRLCKEKKIVRLSHKLFICAENLTKLLELMRKIIAKDGYLDINNFKSHLNLSRKYLITYLDYLDCFEDITNQDGKRTFKVAHHKEA